MNYKDITMNVKQKSTRLASVFLVLFTAFSLLMSGIASAEQILRIGNMGEPASLDPHHIDGVWESRIVSELFLGLTTQAEDGSIIPGAAKSWKISDKGTVYTFTLRDSKWSDGKPVRAQDFEYAMKRILNPKTAAAYASLLYVIKNAREVNSGQLPVDQLGVKALNDKTLRITLTGPKPYFLALLTHYTTFPLREDVIEKLGHDWAKDSRMVSNGPYKLAQWIPNAQIELVKNNDFYNAKNVAIDKVYFYPQEDRSAMLKRFRAGEVDIVTDFSSSDLTWIKQHLARDVHIAPYLGVYYYPMNMQKNKALKDIRVRKALSMVINRQVITDKVLKSGEIPAYSFVPPNTGTYGQPSYVPWKNLSQGQRIKKAQQLMVEAGYDRSHPLKLTLSYNTSENHKKVAIAVAAMWKSALNVQTELMNTEVKVHYANLKKRNYDVARAGWVGDYNDPQNFLFLLESKNIKNYAGFNDPQYDQLMQKASVEFDMHKRDMLLHKAEQIAMNKMPVIPIFYYISKNLVSPKVQGWKDNVMDVHRIQYMSIKK
ncbi:peptide ABC transporter substrate-binding protein [Celerinatantimonas yamalensis]|uniref:Peptide ABC transporter substrate-binding protein n=1 Tax=Celerinatantimonas yamalensis TaxID=559956 RepID=A0ABW9G9X1_9GAMM